MTGETNYQKYTGDALKSGSKAWRARMGELPEAEAAALAGVLKAAAYYNPYRYPARALRRRNIVLSQMEKYGIISADSLHLIKKKPLSVQYHRITGNEGPAPYFLEHLRLELKQTLDTLKSPDGTPYNLFTDGLSIETTIDSRIQKAAEKAVQTQMKQVQVIFNAQLERNPVWEKDDPAIIKQWERSEHYKKLKASGATDEEISKAFNTPVSMNLFSWEGEIDTKITPRDSLHHYLSFLNSGFLVMEPRSGNLLAWVGGINHRYFKYDHVKSRRQTGSAFKPVVYAAALEAGFAPCDYRRSRLSVYHAYDEWTPQNISEEYGGRYSIQAALANSINTISVDLLMDTGIENVLEIAKRTGITSKIPFEPSIALGTAEVSLMELVRAYSSFLNGGVAAAPRYLKNIYDAEGRLIYSSQPGDNAGGHEMAMSSETAAAMVQMLSKTVDEGTGSALRSRFGITHALAGKTGTTQNYTDGWFVGMTPDLVFGAWVGGWSPRLKFDSEAGYASRTALPIAGYFLQNLRNYQDLKHQEEQFYPHQINNPYFMNCSDYKDERFIDKFLDFFNGKSSDQPRVVKEEKQENKKSFFGRIKNIFKKE